MSVELLCTHHNPTLCIKNTPTHTHRHTHTHIYIYISWLYSVIVGKCGTVPCYEPLLPPIISLFTVLILNGLNLSEFEI